MMLVSVCMGTLPGNPIYVQGMQYDTAGRVTLRTAGHRHHPGVTTPR
jgi:hypothetical protein